MNGIIKQCKRGHINVPKAPNRACKICYDIYNKSVKGRLRRRKYDTSIKGKVRTLRSRMHRKEKRIEELETLLERILNGTTEIRN